MADEEHGVDETASVPNDEFAVALIRSYLTSRGMKDVIRVLDSEMPQTMNPSAISTSAAVRALRMRKLYKKNKEKEVPLKSILELTTSYFFKPVKDKTKKKEAGEPTAAAAAGSSTGDAPAASLPAPVSMEDALEALLADGPTPQPKAAPAPVVKEAPVKAPPAVVPAPVAAVAPAPAPATTAPLGSLSTDISQRPPVTTAPLGSLSTDISQRPHTSSGGRAPRPTAPPPTAPPPKAAFGETPAPVGNGPTESSTSVGGTGFWDRINKAKAVAPAAVDPPAALTAVTAPPTGTPAAPPAPAAPAGPVGGGGFWERLNASKQASATGAPAAPPAVTSGPVTPATVASGPPGTGGASGGSVGGGSFWERLNASKAGGSAPAEAARPSTAPVFQWTAPDGTGFNDRAAYRRYMFETCYTFRGKSGEKLMKLPGQIDGQPFSLERLDNCEVLLLDHSETVQADHITNCKIFIGSSCESVFLRNVSNCVITLACKQLRTRDCANCVLNLYTKTDPIIEASSHMTFGPFNGAYPGLATHMRKANLDPVHNHWRRVFDFSKDDTSLPNPHWSLMDVSRSVPWEIPLAEHGIAGEVENPVPITAAPADDGDQTLAASVLAFDIKSTSQKDAQRLLEAAATAKPLLPGGKPPNVKPNNSAAPPPASVPGGFWDRLNAGKSGTAPPPVLPSPAPTPAVIAPAATPPLSTVSTALPAGVPVTGEAAIDEDEDLMNEILEEAQ